MSNVKKRGAIRRIMATVYIRKMRRSRSPEEDVLESPRHETPPRNHERSRIDHRTLPGRISVDRPEKIAEPRLAHLRRHAQQQSLLPSEADQSRERKATANRLDLRHRRI